jgi:ubiquinone/menaquinone biosynthesis C-methylase UbiE
MDWHKRYTQQARWTRALRSYLFREAGLHKGDRILEVGCGTGAILAELPTVTRLHGLDIDRATLSQCRVHAPAATLVQGNALALPYPDRNFDIVYCHFLLLWVSDPLQAVQEMKRVTKPGAHVLAFAEPDYSARRDEPGELASLGQWQLQSLEKQGANPALGARLAELFFQAGLKLIETGQMQSKETDLSPEEWKSEWEVFESDLAGSIPAEAIRRMRFLDKQARERGERVLHVPTYFAWGHA